MTRITGYEKTPIEHNIDRKQINWIRHTSKLDASKEMNTQEHINTKKKWRKQRCKWFSEDTHQFSSKFSYTSTWLSETNKQRLSTEKSWARTQRKSALITSIHTHIQQTKRKAQRTYQKHPVRNQTNQTTHNNSIWLQNLDRNKRKQFLKHKTNSFNKKWMHPLTESNSDNNSNLKWQTKQMATGAIWHTKGFYSRRSMRSQARQVLTTVNM